MISSERFMMLSTVSPLWTLFEQVWPIVFEKLSEPKIDRTQGVTKLEVDTDVLAHNGIRITYILFVSRYEIRDIKLPARVQEAMQMQVISYVQ